jgi:hypothetical protein
MTKSTRLDVALLHKIVQKTGKPEKYVREQISKRASRLGVSSEAALILWAKQLKLGTAVALRKLPSHAQQQVRDALPTLFAIGQLRPRAGTTAVHSAHRRQVDPLSLAIDYLLADQELKSRCGDLLRKHSHLDRALREATTILENRVKRLANITGSINPEALVNKTLNPDPSKAILVVSKESSEQAGFHSICRGIVLAFRHRAHHQLDEKVTREDALKFCAFIDMVLTILEQASIQPVH